MIEAAYAQDVLHVWTEDEAAPYRTLPSADHHRHGVGEPARYPHEYVREGTAK